MGAMIPFLHEATLGNATYPAFNSLTLLEYFPVEFAEPDRIPGQTPSTPACLALTTACPTSVSDPRLRVRNWVNVPEEQRSIAKDFA